MSARSPGLFTGALLIAAGGLVATLSGLCSVTLLGPNVVAVLRGSAPLRSLTPALVLVGIFGGLPFAAGVTTVVMGVRLLRDPKRGGS